MFCFMGPILTHKYDARLTIFARGNILEPTHILSHLSGVPVKNVYSRWLFQKFTNIWSMSFSTHFWFKQNELEPTQVNNSLI